jgi:hypothetical protein
MSNRERQQRWRQRDAWDLLVLNIETHRWALSDPLIAHGFLQLLDRGNRAALQAALEEFCWMELCG